MTIYAKGATSVSEFVLLTDSTTHIPKTGVTVTGITLQYLTKHATGGYTMTTYGAYAAGAINVAWNATLTACEIGLGFYRIDLPNALFAGTNGNRAAVILTCTGCDQVNWEIELSPKVDAVLWAGSAIPHTTPTPFAGV